MNRAEFRNCIESLAEHYGLRWSERGHCYLGIRRGVFVELRDWDGEALCTFISPTAEIGNQVLEKFVGFNHSIEGGLPGDWIGGVMEFDAAGQQTTSHRGCVVRLDFQRVESLGVDGFIAFPNAVVDDLLERGATESVLCGQCGEKPAEVVGRLNGVWHPFCTNCWDDIQFEASAGNLSVEHTINWSRTAPTLLTLTVAGGFLWGLIQQPGEVPFEALLLPAAWAYFLCWVCLKISGGVTRTLRFTLFGSVIASVLTGNIWGFRTAMLRQLQQAFGPKGVVVRAPDWLESIETYFRLMPVIWKDQIPFFAGGILGAWIGLKRLKVHESIEVQ